MIHRQDRGYSENDRNRSIKECSVAERSADIVAHCADSGCALLST